MKISFFADENIQESLIKWLKEIGHNISGIREENLYGLDDETIIQKAFSEKKIIITHDSDFGKIIFTKNVKFYSVIFFILIIRRNILSDFIEQVSRVSSVDCG